MERVYKVLLPLYKPDEIREVIDCEWLMDSRGNENMKFRTFLKVLFRIAHCWAIHIDVDEYVDLDDLDRLMMREFDSLCYGQSKKHGRGSLLFNSVIGSFPEMAGHFLCSF